MPANRSMPADAATTRARDTSSAGSSRRCGEARYPRAWRDCSRGSLLNAAACDVEKYFLQRRPVVAGHDAVRGVVVLDAAAFHDDDAVAQSLHFEHVVRGQQDGRAMRLAIGLEMLPDPVGGIGIEGCRRFVH